MIRRRATTWALLAALAALTAGSPVARAAPGPSPIVAPARSLVPLIPARPTTPMLREITAWSLGPKTGLCRITLDLASQHLRVSMSRESDSPFTSTRPLYASVTAPVFDRSFVSIASLAAKARPFEDGLTAAVELATQQNIGGSPGRVAFLRMLHGLLVQGKEDPARARAAALIAAALELGGTPANPPPKDLSAVQVVRTAFLRRPEVSQPLSFYSWTPELRRIFQRDRLLAEPLRLPEAMAIARALGASSVANQAYRAILDLNAVLNNPIRQGWNDLRTLPRLPRVEDRLALFPPARDLSLELMEEKFSRQPPPRSFDVVREVISRVRSARLSLSPRKGSGWQDHLLYALEPLILPNFVPEMRYRHADTLYCDYLEDLFKALFAQVKELMIKGGGGGFGAGTYFSKAWRFVLKPTVEVEPLPTHFLRRAHAYRFIRQGLARTLGSATLSRLRGLRLEGTVSLSLERELREMESLFYGSYLASAFDLGMPAAPQADLGLVGGQAVSLAFFRRWASHQSSDPDIGRDVRMMVPVYYDAAQRKTKVWVLMGVRKESMTIHTAGREPRILRILDPQGRPIPLGQADLQWEGLNLTVPQLVVAEVFVRRVLDRKAFRRHCDRWKTSKAILANLR